MVTSTLPCKEEVPQHLAGNTNLKLWFCNGFQDAMNDRELKEKSAFIRNEGDAVWDAYFLGYEAGKRKRLLMGAQPAG